MVIFTTLAEKKYFLGVSALINSIVDNGTYGDKIIIGYRGALPSWLPKMNNSRNGKSFIINSNFEIEFVEIGGTLHMVHEKPMWFKRIKDILEPNADEYFFFDSDLIIVNRMSFFGEWVKEGVAICEDINFDMSSSHPIRQKWKKIAMENGLTIKREINKYYNSGFIGWTRNNSEFIDDWCDCISLFSNISGDMKKIRVNNRTNIVLSANQDSLNLATMITSSNISTLGPEAMGFQYGLALMAHPIGPKPWNRNFFTEFILGVPPRVSDVYFWKYIISNDLKPVPKYFASYKLMICYLLRFLSRFYRKL